MEDSTTRVQNFILGLWGVRYQVKEVQRSIAFYTKVLGFNLDHQNLPAFGQVSNRVQETYPIYYEWQPDQYGKGAYLLD